MLRRRRFFSGGYVRGSGLKDIVWFRPDGAEMSAEDWESSHTRSLGMLLGGDAIPSLDQYGEQIIGDTLLILINAHHEPLSFVLPAIEWGEDWEVQIDTRSAAQPEIRVPTHAGEQYELESRSIVVMRLAEKGEQQKAPLL